MEPLSRTEIKEIFTEAIESLVVEFKASHDAHEKDIDRLNKQSSEHYLSIKNLEDKITSQVMTCQAGNTHSMERSGERTGKIEIEVSKINLRVAAIESELLENKGNKQFNITQWLVVAGVVAMIVLGVIPLIKG